MAPTATHKIDHDPQALQALLVELFLQAHSQPPDSITLDLDATDDPFHGEQRDRFFHGYYGGYCYLPLYIFCDRHLLCALLRPPTSMPPPVPSSRSSASSPTCAANGLMSRSCCGPTPALPGSR